MDIASMVDLIDMIKHLDEENERISDWVFISDGKSIVVDLTSGESYRFSVNQENFYNNMIMMLGGENDEPDGEKEL